MNQRLWLVQRAALALLLMVSFYALALGVAGALLWVPYEAYANDVRLPAKLALLCVAGAGLIVWAILPRFDRFVAPGPRITAADAPHLFSTIADVAAATGQAMPADVYLVNDVNAFVGQRGGVMGIGSHRVMGLGLPLLQSLTVQELKGVLAHEFGHYHAGDVRIGPWIYRTRVAIGRTIEQLSGNYLQKIFVAYGNLFLRVTHAVSRRQEFIADEVAARTAGALAMASALRKVRGAALAFQNYWHSEVGPVLNSGYLPPLSSGFAQFVQVKAVSAQVAESVRRAEAEDTSDPYDTHPALRERIAALQTLPPGSDGDQRPAVSLLGDPQQWERRILGVSINEDWARTLMPIAWDTVLDTVYLPQWRNGVRESARLIEGLSIVQLPFAGRLTSMPFREEDQPILHQVHVVTLALSIALLAAGWTGTTSPGEEIRFRRDGQEIRPFGELMDLAFGTVTPQQWSDRCKALAIDALPLAVAKS
jgi:heat shock protein HtpX